MEWDKLLCPKRIRDVKAKPGSGDLRTEFEKDYHRIIGSASFRRLQDKTQVFPLDKSDFIRTRLTHSLEVSSFAKSLGQNISQKILREIKDPTFLPQYQADVCDILQCAGLLHDIGNPPFGHFGETVIREWFRANMSKVELKGQKFKVHAAKVLDEAADAAPGTILGLTKTGLKMACGDGVIEIRQLQAEGGKRMAAPDYFRGHPLEGF